MALNPDFFKFIGLFRIFPRGSYQDITDYLASYVCSSLYILLCCFLGIRGLVGNTIQCWVPREFSSAWEDYVEQYCWVEGTYWAHWDQPFPKKADRLQDRVTYYQWVPLFFIALALICYLPDVAWRVYLSATGAQFRSVAELLKTIYQQTEANSRKKILQESSYFLWQIVTSASDSKSRRHPRIRCGCHLFSSYLFYKLSSIVFVCLQLIVCWYFIDHPSPLFGWHLARHLITGRGWSQTGNFPRVAFCDVNVRGLGAARVHTVQCALPVNMVNEVFFIIVWFYLVGVLGLLIIASIAWIGVMLTPGISVRLIRQCLNQSRANISAGEQKYLAGFVAEFFRVDGVFLLRMMNRETGEIITGQVVGQLWCLYKDDCRKRADGSSEIEGLNHLTMV